jgi:hypothetical protein
MQSDESSLMSSQRWKRVWQSGLAGLKYGLLSAALTAIVAPLVLELSTGIGQVSRTGTWAGTMGGLSPAAWPLTSLFVLAFGGIPLILSCLVISWILHLLRLPSPRVKQVGRVLGFVTGPLIMLFWLMRLYSWSSTATMSSNEDLTLIVLFGLWGAGLYWWLGRRLADVVIEARSSSGLGQ